MFRRASWIYMWETQIKPPAHLCIELSVLSKTVNVKGGHIVVFLVLLHTVTCCQVDSDLMATLMLF